MRELQQRPLKHVLVCVNERENEDSCINVGGMELFLYLKNYVRNNGLTSRVWITKTKCLGFCNSTGTTIVIYPEGKWITEIKEDDYENIIKELF